MASGFAIAGASVACAVRSKALSKTSTAGINNEGVSALAIVADVTREVDVQHIFQQTVEHFGGLDILFITAGGNFDQQAVAESDSVNWRKTHELNLKRKR